MKRILCLLMFVFLILPVNAVTLEGSVTYTVEQAREEAFKDVEWTIPWYLIKKHKKDPNHSVNVMGKDYPHVSLGYRQVTYFSDGHYACRYIDNIEYGFYYDAEGKLDVIDKGYSSVYPHKTYKYNLKGKLIAVTFHVSEEDCYIFKPNGELVAYWKGKICYDTDGNIRLNRK